jgi:hypothetical protein
MRDPLSVSWENGQTAVGVLTKKCRNKQVVVAVAVGQNLFRTTLSVSSTNLHMNTNNGNMNEDHRRPHHQTNNDNDTNGLPSLPAIAAAEAARAHVHNHHRRHHRDDDHAFSDNILAAAIARAESPTEDALNSLRMSHSDIIANRSSNNSPPPPSRFHDNNYDYENDAYSSNNNISNNTDPLPPHAAATQFWQRATPPPPVALRGLLMLHNNNNDKNTNNESEEDAAMMKKRTFKNKKIAGDGGKGSSSSGVYPLPAYCNFIPGGIGYNHASLTMPTTKVASASLTTSSGNTNTTTTTTNNNNMKLDIEGEEDGILVHLSRYCDSGTASTIATTSATPVASPKAGMSRGTSSNLASPKNNTTSSSITMGRFKLDSTPTPSTAAADRRPEIIIRRALLADMTLRKYALHSLRQAEKNLNNNNSTGTHSSLLGHRLPSLSQLAHSALVNPLTAVSANHAVLWAERMILEYMDGRLENQLMFVSTPSSEQHDVLITDRRLLQMKMEYEDQMNQDLLLSSSSSTFTLEEEDADHEEQGKKRAFTTPSSSSSSSSSAQRLLQRAIVSAWAQEEAMTGRTPTNHAVSSSINININDHSRASKVTKDNALMMELPTLKGLLQACWRVQRGEEQEEENEDYDEENEMNPTKSTARSSVASLSSSSCGSNTATAAPLPHSKYNNFIGSPCGYVFRRGDIAWNCRTCQTDPTCVLCDNCFRESDHVGHEVLFHRTSPGGCCDCGDLEAWNPKGMCSRHRPPPQEEEEEEKEDEEEEEGIDNENERLEEDMQNIHYGQDRSMGKRRKKKDEKNTNPFTGGIGGGGMDDDFEAVRSAQRTRLDHERHVNGVPAKNVTIGNATPCPLPPRLTAALATVIASTIQSILFGVEGSAIGADVSQWRLHWADEICKVWNGVSEDEEYYRRGAMLWEQLIDEKRRSKMKDEMKERSSSSSSSIDEEIAQEMEMEKDCLWAHPRHVLDSHNKHYASELPPNYNLLLRLHNDDVHTFEEVINALHSKSGGPIPVPIGGRGSAGEVGGAGITGEELAIRSRAEAWTEERIGGVTQFQRNRPFAEDSESIQQQRRVYRTYSSSNSSSGGSRGGGGASSPTSNRSYPSNDIAGPNTLIDNEDPPLSPSGTLQFASEVDPSAPLIPPIDVATELTRRVDADGQVSVRAYGTINDAGIGFSRLRESAGLHCAVLTSARIESEERAKVLLEWLGSLIGSHPAVSAIIVQCLVDVTEGEDVLCSEKNKTVSIPGKCRGVVGWSTPKMMPCWSGTSEMWSDKASSNIFVPAWRRRFDAFPPYLESSYLTREEGRELFRLGIISENSKSFIHATGTYCIDLT